MRWPAEFVRGIGKRNGAFVIIPNLERIFATQGRRSALTAEERAA
jgi:purine-binding chemotaxis protein CheW